MAWNRPAYSRANWQETCTKTEDWRRRSAYNRPWSSILSPDQAARLAMKNVLSLILGGGRGTRLYPADHAAQQAGRARSPASIGSSISPSATASTAASTAFTS